jgi:hypothetical protein
VSDPQEPPIGNMYLWDDVTPPLDDGSYRLTVSTAVPVDNTTKQLSKDFFFDIDGPRFQLSPSDVAMVHPPRNGHGAFHLSLPQIALYRRTLPWERPLDGGSIGTPTPGPVPSPKGRWPWIALLLFEDSDGYTILENMNLVDVVGSTVFQRLGSPAGVTCAAVEAPLALVQSIMPSKNELLLLAHVRQVNHEDRELAAGSSDGWFSVVVSNRLPSPGAKCRACLVSVEERADLVSRDPLPPSRVGGNADAPIVEALIADAAIVETPVVDALRVGRGATTRLVLLYSWQFTSEGTGTFREIMSNSPSMGGVDVAMFGTVRGDKPVVTDTGHLPIELRDRAGAIEPALYRGPLVPYPLTRDPLGPYHSADQARRVAPEGGAEDIAYAAAFEVGRLLAAADQRLAQELMRWRRQAYSASGRADVITSVQAAIKLQPVLAAQLDTSLVPVVAAGALARVLAGGGPIVDGSGLAGPIAQAPGLDPALVQTAWNLPSIDAARAVLGGDPGALGAVVRSPAYTPRPSVTLAEVASDTAGLADLSTERDVAIARAQAQTGSVRS